MGVVSLGATRLRAPAIALICAIAALASSAAPASGAVTPCGPPNVIAVIAGKRPLGCWRPYVAASPWNLRIDTGAQLDTQSGQLGASIGSPANVIGGWAGTSHDYARPVYFS